jgi:hypothetical protein
MITEKFHQSPVSVEVNDSTWKDHSQCHFNIHERTRLGKCSVGTFFKATPSLVIRYQSATLHICSRPGRCEPRSHVSGTDAPVP